MILEHVSTVGRAVWLRGLMIVSAVALSAGASRLDAQTPDGNGSGAWSRLALEDLEFIRGRIDERYIYAVYPGSDEWRRSYEEALRIARRDAAQIKDLNGYRAVLVRFANSFHDQHVGIAMNTQPVRVEWPGFSVRYDGARALVTASENADAANGAEVASCDGVPAATLIDRVAGLEGGIPGTGSGRAEFAGRLLVDQSNPFIVRSKACTIGGREVVLDWRPIGLQRLKAKTEREIGVPIGYSEFGNDGAWIRLPTMSPADASSVDAYRKVIALGPSLRTRKVIVFDVRGNAGGAYNWFMAMLTALYGKDATDVYARERLRIRPVFVQATLPSTKGNSADGTGRSAMMRSSGMPPDVALEAALGGPQETKLSNGRIVTIMEPKDIARLEKPKTAVPDFRLLVLTDAGCKSACLSFLDEVRNLPRTSQIGADAGVDMRSGSPARYPLPSGLATFGASTMVRENRRRGENEESIPAYRYTGDIADTDAVMAWIRQSVPVR